MALVARSLPPNAGDIGDVGSIPGSGRPPGGGHGNPLQYSCLENSMNRGALWATVHGVAKSWTQLSTHTHTAVDIKLKKKKLLFSPSLKREKKSL